MKIRDNYSRSKFSSIESGDVFKSAASSDVYVKTADGSAVRLRDGQMVHLTSNFEVTLLPNAVLLTDGEA